MAACDWVCLDGALMRAEDAHVPLFDRGLLFAHAAYEVTAVCGGRLIDAGPHMARLERTLAGLDLPQPASAEALIAIHDELIARNGLDEGVIYLQVTAGGDVDRDFAGPETLTPRYFLFAQKRPLVGDAARDGIGAITLDDTRWARRDLKTTQLLSQALAYRRARAAGAQTAIMHEDGMVTEAASSNIWIVDSHGALLTRNLSPAILGGITRQALLSLTDIPVREAAFPLEALKAAREIIQTSSGAMVLPIVSLDGAPVGNGKPGPVARALQKAYFLHLGLDLETRAPWLND